MRVWRVFGFKVRVGDVIAVLIFSALMLLVFGELIFSPTPRRPPLSKCMTNMYNIATALKMFNQDNNRYPTSLAGTVQWDKNGNVIPFDQTKGDGIFPEYTRGGSGAMTFHCPLSPTTARDAVVRVTDGTTKTYYYAYDSYDVYYPAEVQPRTSAHAGPNAIHYNPNWAPDVPSVTSRGLTGTNPPEEDYKRQLRFKSPPDDTVVTWCNNHAGRGNDRIPVLFLSGQADMVRAETVASSKWRIMPRR